MYILIIVMYVCVQTEHQETTHFYCTEKKAQTL